MVPLTHTPLTDASSVHAPLLLLYPSCCQHLSMVVSVTSSSRSSLSLALNDGAPQREVTALMCASLNGFLEVVKALMASGADVNAMHNVGVAG